MREQRRLDPMIDAALARGWPLKRIETVLRAILRAGAYELAHRSDVPARVVVSEYVDVAGAFVDEDETGMVNAVLDQLARQLRAAEFDSRSGLAAITPHERQRGRAAEIRRRIPRHFLDSEVIFRHALEEALHRNLGDEPRHLRCRGRNACPSRTRDGRRPPVDVEGVGIGKFPCVAIAEPNASATLSPTRIVWPCSSFSRMTTRLKRCAEVLKRSDSSMAGAISAGSATRRSRASGWSCRLSANMLMKLDSDFDARHDEGRGREHDLALAQPVAVDFGFGEMRDQVVGRIGAPRRHFRGEKIARVP